MNVNVVLFKIFMKRYSREVAKDYTFRGKIDPFRPGPPNQIWFNVEGKTYKIDLEKEEVLSVTINT